MLKGVGVAAAGPVQGPETPLGTSASSRLYRSEGQEVSSTSSTVMGSAPRGVTAMVEWQIKWVMCADQRRSTNWDLGPCAQLIK